MSTVDFRAMSDAELISTVARIDWRKFPENYDAAVAEMERRNLSMDSNKDFSKVGLKAVEFRGDANEYFKIWIINACLSILTLGIYSAWAKVKTRRYFLRNTYVNETSFDYHGDPIKILKGRLLMGVFLALYVYGPRLNPWIGLVTALVFWGLFPWIVVRANIFNLGNTSYRNIRFGFLRDYKGSYKELGWAMFISIITLGIGSPFFWYTLTKFRISRSRYGSTFFEFKGKSDDFFTAYYGAAGIGVLGVIVAAILSMILKGLSDSTLIKGMAFTIPFLFVWPVVYAFVRSRVFNTMVNNTNLSQIIFKAKISGLDLAKIYITNVLASIFSLGMLVPWAMIRLQKFKLSHIYISAPETVFSTFVAQSSEPGSATADALGDFWDIDLGL